MISRTPTMSLLVCTVICAASCGTAPRRAELRLCLPDEPKTFDPLQVEDESSEIVRYLTGGTLLRIDRLTDAVRPRLAESWTVDDGGKSITFTLRPGLKFSDGTALTAEDVARTLRTALDPKNASPVGDTFRSEGGPPAIEVSSPLRITIRYPGVKAGLERLFDELSIVPQHASRVPSSAGPFFISDYQPGIAVLLKRNPWYWERDAAGNPLPYLDSVRLDIQSNADIQIAHFMRGETDILRTVGPDDFDRISKQEPGAARDLGPSLDADFLWFNQVPGAVPEYKRKWFTSAAFRHAVSKSIHREDLAKVVFRNHAVPASGPLSSANKFWFNPDLTPLPFDPDSAIAMLRAEGFSLNGNVLSDKDQHPVEFSLITNAGNRSREGMATLIQSDLAKIGIKLNVVTLDKGALFDRIARTSQYEACLLGFTNMDVDPNEQMNVWLSSGAMHAWWPNQKSPATDWEARIDRLALAQASDPSRESRRQAFNEVQRILVQQEPIIYLVNPNYLSAISPSLGNLKFSALFPQALANLDSLRLR